MPRTLFQKFLVCFLAGLVIAITVVRIGWRFLYHLIPGRPMLAIGVLILLTGMVYPFVWNRKKDPVAAEKIFSCWIGVMRYGIALELIMVGMQKWFSLQFNTPMAKLDLPFSSFSSEELVWAFFGYSRGFVMVIGSLQVGGSLLLLFNRTRLFGTVILIPVMLNIFLMDLFYHFYPGEWFSALVVLAALIYLLLLDYKKLAALFFGGNGSFSATVFRSQLLKNAVRFSAVLIPLAMIGVNPTPYKLDWFSGKYAVEQVSVNGHPLGVRSCTDSVLSIIYFDQNNECVFECNGVDRRLFGTYLYEKDKNKLTVIWHYPRTMQDTLWATIPPPKPGAGLILTGRMRGESLRAVLRKVE
ncbi:MAG TPA: hypothetical protein VK563_24010 [Puia sp.]|nr:hypothetical protein [Puia sp.]